MCCSGRWRGAPEGGPYRGPLPAVMELRPLLPSAQGCGKHCHRRQRKGHPNDASLHPVTSLQSVQRCAVSFIGFSARAIDGPFTRFKGGPVLRSASAGPGGRLGPMDEALEKGKRSSGERGRAPGFSTRAIHEADLPPGGIAEQPVSPPIWLTADYLYEGLDHYADIINERRPGFVYGRYGNPTHVALNRLLASLEGAEAAWSFASGMAAIHTTLTALVRTGEHIVAQRTIYGGTFSLLSHVFPGYGIRTTFVEAEAGAVADGIGPGTRAVLVETLANPTFRVADIEGIAAICAEREIPLVVDNTIATPY